MGTIIEIQNLSKQYRSRVGHKAVDNLSLSVEEGDIFGFVGPNGAGKTSTLRIIATLLQPTAGDIFVAGHSVVKDPRSVREVIGYMPDFFGVYNDMLVWEYIDFFCACYQIPENQRSTLIEDLLELVDLSHRKSDPVEELSRGMKQRLSLARTLIHDPKVLILDEPASGLDPRARIEIRDLLVQLSKMGKTIFFSTHILSDVAEICTRVSIIEAGKIVAVGELEELQQQLVPNRIIHLTVSGTIEPALKFLQNNDKVINIKAINGNPLRGRLEFGFIGNDENLSNLLVQLIEEKIPVLHFQEDNRDLEEVFMRATQGLVT